MAILGHEAGHYPERDSLKGLRSAKDKSAAAMVLGMLGPVGAIASPGRGGQCLWLFARPGSAGRPHRPAADAAGGLRRARVPPRVGQPAGGTQGHRRRRGGPARILFATHPAPRQPPRHAAADGRRGRWPARHRGTEQRWWRPTAWSGCAKRSAVASTRKAWNCSTASLRADDAQFLYARGEVYRLRDRTEDLQPALDDLQRGAASSGRRPTCSVRSGCSRSAGATRRRPPPPSRSTSPWCRTPATPA